jgi:hypothetical protein
MQHLQFSTGWNGTCLRDLPHKRESLIGLDLLSYL